MGAFAARDAAPSPPPCPTATSVRRMWLGVVDVMLCIIVGGNNNFPGGNVSRALSYSLYLPPLVLRRHSSATLQARAAARLLRGGSMAAFF